MSENSTGVLLVAFGTTVNAARRAYRVLGERVAAEFPGMPVRWAYTSHQVRRRAGNGGPEMMLPEMALADMVGEGFEGVAVQSFHVIPGFEFHNLVRTANAFSTMGKGLKRVSVGRPLLGGSCDLERVADALLATFPAERRRSDAVVLMGHGTKHPSAASYTALHHLLQQRDDNVFLGVPNGYPDLADIREMLSSRGSKKAYLMPFMTVAGEHALSDLAGAGKDSWASVLSREGIDCVGCLRGIAEIDAISSVWIDHLREALSLL